MRILSGVCLVVCLMSCGGEIASSPEPPAGILDVAIGEVHFPSSCNAAAASLVERGVGFLHHMMYDEANFVFSMADDRDPECSIAYWGQAMTIIHPLWPDLPTREQLERGQWFVAQAAQRAGQSAREDAYLATAAAYFENAGDRTEGERLAAFEVAWKTLIEAHPDDLEGQAFYSLALRAVADNNDPDLVRQKEAGLIAERVLAQVPEHPGAHHYIIHAYDYPALAAKALPVANHYGEITPRVPHAAHMMTHIYTRLGHWEQAIEWNRVSADAAWDLCLQFGQVSSHFTHALDYLGYAYLQTGRDEKVVELIEQTASLEPPYAETNLDASAYALAALPARYALERRDWEAATHLQPHTPVTFPWAEQHDAYVANSYFARALGHARLGNPDAAAADIEALGQLRARVATFSGYWAGQVAIQEETARAWRLYALGDVPAALQRMAQARAMEAATEKHSVTPGQVLPAAELHGDMLLAEGQFAAALDAYRASLTRAPLRFNSLQGAAEAALAAGDRAAARDYLQTLIAMVDADSTRPALDDSRRLLRTLEAG